MTTALDTNVAIDLLRRRTQLVRERFTRAMTDGRPMVVSLMVFHELMYGAARSAHPSTQRANVVALLQDVPVERLDEADMTAAAELRAQLSRRGLGIGPYDALIAGQALNRGWTLVTANSREFSRIEGLAIEDWSQPTT